MRNRVISLIVAMTLAMLGTETPPTVGPAATPSPAAHLPHTPTLDLAPTPTPTPTPTPAQAATGRYSAITLTDADRDLLARIVYLEARGESAAGQQAVAEVVLNRVLSDAFPDSIYAVIHQRGQFSTARKAHRAQPTAAQYAAIDAALNGPHVLPETVVYFSRGAQNARVWGRIGGHVFCHE